MYAYKPNLPLCCRCGTDVLTTRVSVEGGKERGWSKTFYYYFFMYVCSINGDQLFVENRGQNAREVPLYKDKRKKMKVVTLNVVVRPGFLFFRFSVFFFSCITNLIKDL